MKKILSIFLMLISFISITSCSLINNDKSTDDSSSSSDDSSDSESNNEKKDKKDGTGGSSHDGGGGSSSSSVTYSAANTIDTNTTLTSGTYTSSTTDQNALSIEGSITANLSGITATKTGDSDGGDNTSFYGINSAIIAKDGANVTLDKIKVTTTAVGGNGVFSYGGYATTSNTNGDGTTVTITNSTITTTKDNSGGIMTTGGGKTYATNLTIETSGISSAAIRTDRGGGTVVVSQGTYTTNGKGSPAVYSTADVTVKDKAVLISNVSEGIVVEGKNSVTIDDITLTDTNSENNGNSTSAKNIFLYQSMSGDADDGTTTFTASNSTITTNVGDSLYITNTTAVINLTNNTFTNNDSSGNFLRAKADSWGSKGSNGGLVTLNADDQDMEGNIVIDSISTLAMNMTNYSSFTGTINGDNTAKTLSLVLDSTSSITLTGNSYVTSFTNSKSDNSNINFNGYKLYVNGVAIN